MRYSKQILVTVFLIFVAISSFASKSEHDTFIQPKSVDLDVYVSYCVSDQNEFNQPLKSAPDCEFRKLKNQPLSRDSVYWIKLEIVNHSTKENHYLLHFNNTISHLEAYVFSKDSLIDIQKSGVLVPYNQRTITGFKKDNVSLSIKEKESILVFLKVRNKLGYKHLDKYLTFTTRKHKITITKSSLKLGFFMGSITLLVVLTLTLRIFSRDSIYLVYAFYMIFISIYFASIYQITETVLFKNLPKLDLYAEWSLYISQNLYLLFLSIILKKEKLEKKRINVSSILYFTLPLLGIMFIISLNNYELSRIMHYFYSTIYILIAIALVIVFYKNVKLQVRLIFIGTLCMVCGAFIDTVGINPKLPGLYYSHMGFFQTGILIELILFMIAVLYSFFNEIRLKHDIEKNQLKMQMEKLQKEKENILLKQEVDKTYRELASTSIRLTQKETLITNMMQKLSLLKDENTNKKELGDLISGLKQHLSNNGWTEFEYYFNQVNPDFYSALLKTHPNLTVNEKKICAYLKLNLNTKEIASISGKSINSIEVARTRLRKKLELEPYQNIYTYISTI